jgi:hypothetical protein
MTNALLVVGSAPCAYDDYAKAKEAYPFAETMVVNGASSMIEDADHVLIGHFESAKQFLEARKAAFPDCKPYRIHADCEGFQRRYEQEFPFVTDWWKDKISGCGVAGTAAMIGLAMGFNPIILCGCPFDGSGYSFEAAEPRLDPNMPRIGSATDQDKAVIKKYRFILARLAQYEFKDRVFSMSGYTRAHLGPPPALQGI